MSGRFPVYYKHCQNTLYGAICCMNDIELKFFFWVHRSYYHVFKCAKLMDKGVKYLITEPTVIHVLCSNLIPDSSSIF